MKNTYWFIGTVIILVFFASAAVDWIAQPPSVQAALSEAAASQPEAQAAANLAHDNMAHDNMAQPLAGASPVVQIAVGLFFGLFCLLAVLPVVQDETPAG